MTLENPKGASGYARVPTVSAPRRGEPFWLAVLMICIAAIRPPSIGPRRGRGDQELPDFLRSDVGLRPRSEPVRYEDYLHGRWWQ